MNIFTHNIPMTAQLLLRGGRVCVVTPGSLVERKITMAFVDCDWHGDSGG